MRVSLFSSFAESDHQPFRLAMIRLVVGRSANEERLVGSTKWTSDNQERVYRLIIKGAAAGVQRRLLSRFL